MRRANVQRNWAQLNVPAVQPSTGAPNQGLTGGTANQAALTVLAGESRALIPWPTWAFNQIQATVGG